MAQLISSNEKKKLIEKLNNSKFQTWHFMIGTGHNALNENIELMKHSINNGIDQISFNATGIL